MRFKYYLRGAGIGILVATIILMIAVQMNGGIMTDDRAMRRAAELGMVFAEDSSGTESTTETLDTQDKKAQKDDLQEEETTDALTGATTTRTEQVIEAEAGSQSDAVESGAGSQTDAVESGAGSQNDAVESGASSQNDAVESGAGSEADTAAASGSGVAISIRRGEVCRQVAEDLQSKGLIADSEDFRKFMDRNGFDDKISVGEYEIPAGSTYEEIAFILLKH